MVLVEIVFFSLKSHASSIFYSFHSILSFSGFFLIHKHSKPYHENLLTKHADWIH